MGKEYKAYSTKGVFYKHNQNQPSPISLGGPREALNGSYPGCQFVYLALPIHLKETAWN
jgi:hypothetical protein